MKKLLGSILILSLNAFSGEVPKDGSPIQKELTCPTSITVNLTTVPDGFTSLNGAIFDFLSLEVSGNHARCIYQHLKYSNYQQAIWFYCTKFEKVVETKKGSFVCRKK